MIPLSAGDVNERGRGRVFSSQRIYRRGTASLPGTTARMIDFSPSQIELGQEGIERVAILNLGIPSTIPGTDADFLNFLILQICQIGIRIQWPPWHFMYFRLIGVYGIINQYGLKMVGGPVGGLLSDKLFHSPTKYLRIGYLITAVVLIAFTWMPYQLASGPASSSPWPSAPASTACAPSSSPPMDEVDVPREITGSAMSMASFIGYLPAPSCTPSTAPSSIAIRHRRLPDCLHRHDRLRHPRRPAEHLYHPPHQSRPYAGKITA